MVLVIKIAVAGCDLGNTLVTGKYILFLLAVGNFKMITDVIGGVAGCKCFFGPCAVNFV